MDNSIERDLNYDMYKEQYNLYKKTIREILLKILKAVPREDLIKALKDLKILKEDYNPKTDKLELMER